MESYEKFLRAIYEDHMAKEFPNISGGVVIDLGDFNDIQLQKIVQGAKKENKGFPKLNFFGLGSINKKIISALNQVKNLRNSFGNKKKFDAKLQISPKKNHLDSLLTISKYFVTFCIIVAFAFFSEIFFESNDSSELNFDQLFDESNTSFIDGIEKLNDSSQDRVASPNVITHEPEKDISSQNFFDNSNQDILNEPSNKKLQNSVNMLESNSANDPFNQESIPTINDAANSTVTSVGKFFDNLQKELANLDNADILGKTLTTIKDLDNHEVTEKIEQEIAALDRELSKNDFFNNLKYTVENIVSSMMGFETTSRVDVGTSFNASSVSIYRAIPNDLITNDSNGNNWPNFTGVDVNSAIGSNYPWQRYKAILYIQQNKLKDSKNQLTQLLRDSKFWIRMESIMTLAELGYNVSEAEVKSVISNTSPRLQANFVKRYIDDSSSGQRYILKHLISVAPPNTRYNILRVLYNSRNHTNEEYLLHYLVAARNDPDQKVSNLAKKLTDNLSSEKFQKLEEEYNNFVKTSSQM